jgi:hypothetical protein
MAAAVTAVRALYCRRPGRSGVVILGRARLGVGRGHQRNAASRRLRRRPAHLVRPGHPVCGDRPVSRPGTTGENRSLIEGRCMVRSDRCCSFVRGRIRGGCDPGRSGCGREHDHVLRNGYGLRVRRIKACCSRFSAGSALVVEELSCFKICCAFWARGLELKLQALRIKTSTSEGSCISRPGCLGAVIKAP